VEEFGVGLGSECAAGGFVVCVCVGIICVAVKQFKYLLF
jgi:hypothetical protein